MDYYSDTNTRTAKRVQRYTVVPKAKKDYNDDDVIDTEERFDMVKNEIIKLCNKPIEEIHQWYWSIEQDLRHNYYHFYGKWINQQRNKLYNNLKQIK